MKIYNEELYLMMKKSGLKQCEFAKQIGVTQQAVSTWLNKCLIPCNFTVTKIAKFFGVKPTEVYEWFSRGQELRHPTYDFFAILK